MVKGGNVYQIRSNFIYKELFSMKYNQQFFTGVHRYLCTSFRILAQTKIDLLRKPGMDTPVRVFNQN